MYFSDKIDPDEITVNATSGTLSVSQTNTKKSADHTRSVINFHKAVIYPSDDELDIDIALKNKAGKSYDVETQIFVVVYGVSGTQNDVDVQVWDRYFYVENNKIHFKAPIDMKGKDITSVNKIVTNDLDVNNQTDMKNKKIVNLADGTVNNDAVNKAQLISMQASLVSQITTLNNKLNLITTNDGYYYNVPTLPYNNKTHIYFPRSNPSIKYPFGMKYYQQFGFSYLKILMNGTYQIIITDQYRTFGKEKFKFRIYDGTNSVELFSQYFGYQLNWTPLTINAIIPINIDDGYNEVELIMNVSPVDNAILNGGTNATFFIRYLVA